MSASELIIVRSLAESAVRAAVATAIAAMAIARHSPNPRWRACKACIPALAACGTFDARLALADRPSAHWAVPTRKARLTH